MTVRCTLYGEPAYGGEGPSYGGSITGLPPETLDRLGRDLPPHGPILIGRGAVYFQSPFAGDAQSLLIQAIQAITVAHGEPIPELERLRSEAEEGSPCTPVCTIIRPDLHALIGHSV